MKFQIKFLLYFVTSVAIVSANDFYCSATSEEVVIEGETEGRIITKTEGQRYYSDNTECTWIIQAGPNKRIQLTVEASDLQWKPPNSLCAAYDHVEISDKNETLISWCGKDFPTQIVSKGNWLKIVFKTDATNPRGYVFEGAKVKFTTFDNFSCPPNWQNFNDSCYTITATKHQWDISQKECNRMQSNLLSVKSNSEWEFLLPGLLKSSPEDLLWTGLNDIEKHGHFKWIDNTSVTEFESFSLPSPDRYKHCGVVHTSNGQPYMEVCDGKTLYAVCKASKTGSTELYPIPVTSKNKATDDDGGLARILKIVVLPIAFLLLMALICAVLCRQRLRTAWESRRKSNLREPRDTEEMGRFQEIPQLDRTGGGHAPPPSYDDLNKY